MTAGDAAYIYVCVSLAGVLTRCYRETPHLESRLRVDFVQLGSSLGIGGESGIEDAIEDGFMIPIGKVAKVPHLDSRLSYPPAILVYRFGT